ncbi:extracellular solute-binding protein [Devosia neptuniae]|jgi:raffinose/stachyose/melibiose transport system substrate-binding protein|uniref:ABC transporter substrate-binding protein n=1 Tax=Devosia TaxID=46913 RepID=UPI0022AEE1C8|nr:extracellular solute-binding protein [Devosia neptuniae]MCZ4346467.1 extracellular solute-binding protein [Devosia neptuniae]|tara:strand:+ start:28541 stop:29824 length:1284 start_codon:yes stop_codon:yes gene_type:complete
MTANFTKTARFAVGLLAFTALSAPSWAQSVNLTLLIDNGPQTVPVFEAYVAAFEVANPDISIDIETRPGGGEGDNIVKTRLATGVMADVFTYNSGSLFQAINPQQNLLPLTNEPWQANVQDSFKSVVSSGGEVYGAPYATAMGGGILYNIPIYNELDLEVPTTWDEFMANNEKIKAAGKVAVIQTYGDTWTSQLFVLADYYNVQAAVPAFAEEYTAGTAKYATTPAAMSGFERLEAVSQAGYMNEDFGAAKYSDGIRMVANGEGAHYPMLTFAIGAIAEGNPEHLADVGFFAQPGDSSNGLTTWMPDSLYIPRSTSNEEAAKKFAAFVASPEACAIRNDTVGATGPYLISGCDLPADVPPAVSDMLPYFADGGNNAPALEFLSPIKGPALEQITVEVGSGIRSGADGAALYDQDVRKQAQQLGLEGW